MSTCHCQISIWYQEVPFPIITFLHFSFKSYTFAFIRNILKFLWKHPNFLDRAFYNRTNNNFYCNNVCCKKIFTEMYNIHLSIFYFYFPDVGSIKYKDSYWNFKLDLKNKATIDNQHVRDFNIPKDMFDFLFFYFFAID